MTFLTSKRIWTSLAGVAIAGSLGVFVFRHELIPEYSPGQRGAAVFLESGCVACHGFGPSNRARIPTVGKPPPDYPGVPLLANQQNSPSELREWIENGISERKKSSQAHSQTLRLRALQMPAYQDRLSEGEIGDLIAYLSLAQFRKERRESENLPQGERLARQLGCFQCHGELGQGGVRNPGSLKGSVPGFFGNDFAVLTEDGDPSNVREWIRDGISRAFRDQGFLGFRPGRYFADRQSLKMPAYERFLSGEELDVLAEYVVRLHDLGPLGPTELRRYRELFSAPGSTIDTVGTSVEAAENSFPLFAEVKPVLRRCLNCHGPSDQKSDFRMDTRERLLKGGEISDFLEEPTVRPGAPGEGLLTRFVVAPEDDPDNEVYRMPPKGERLTAEQVALLRRWIEQGVEWPPGATLIPDPENR